MELTRIISFFVLAIGLVAAVPAANPKAAAAPNDLEENASDLAG
jgi:hypothetical protein